MRNTTGHISLRLLLVLSLCAGDLWASPTLLDQAVQRYYAGFPAEAIDMIKPLALAGDADAQYLLGNIIYTLSASGQNEALEDPARWYRMAAAQGSAPATYALGMVHHNSWLQSHRTEDLARAESHLQRALELGEQKAGAALIKLDAYKKERHKMPSLTYTNESFSNKHKSPAMEKATAPPATRQAPQQSTLRDLLAGFESSGDPATDAQKLKSLLGEMHADAPAQGEGPTADQLHNLDTLTGLLSGFDATDRLLSDLIKLYGYIEDATALSTAPGAN